MKRNPAAIALIVEKMKHAMPASEGDSGEGDDGDGDASMSGEEAAASEAMEAFRANDARGFAAAMKRFIELCQAGGYEEPDPDDEE